jgi:hypothetical protein
MYGDLCAAEDSASCSQDPFDRRYTCKGFQAMRSCTSSSYSSYNDGEDFYSCDTTIASSMNGWCECVGDGGVERAIQTRCGHAPFTCSGEFIFLILDDYFYLYATTLTIDFYICYFWIFKKIIIIEICANKCSSGAKCVNIPTIGDACVLPVLEDTSSSAKDFGKIPTPVCRAYRVS